MAQRAQDDDAWWETRALEDLTRDQWEALCDGCGRCCALRFHYPEDPGAAYVSDVGCRLIDPATGGCTDYPNRLRRVRACRKLTPARVLEGWLPTTCAYVLRAKRLRLLPWHHLVNGGDRTEVHRIGIGVAGRITPNAPGIDPEERLVDRRMGECG